MFAAHRSRIIALTIALLVMFPLSIVAANWQWSRHIERDTRNTLISNNTTQPLSFEQLVGSGPRPDDEFRPIKVVGQFQPGTQKLLRKQTLNGEPGYFVLTVFSTDSGRTILVNRGWVRAVGRGIDPGADLSISVQPTTLEGRVRLLEGDAAIDPSDLPIGQTNSALTLLPLIDLQVMIEQTDGQPESGPVPVPLPEIQSGPHLGYVGQWILIGITSIVVYITVLRNLRKEARQLAN